MATSFKKRTVTPDRVQAVEQAAATAPVIGDPRMPSVATAAAQSEVGSSQDRSPAAKVSRASAYEEGRVYDVPLDQIRSNPFNPRAVYTNSALDAMAESLQKKGQQVSATGYLGEGGEVILIEGETRFRGCRAAGLPTLRVEIKLKPGTDRELYEQARAANVDRRDQSPLDDAIRWKELLTVRKTYPSQVALAKALNLSEDHVSRTLSLASLPTRVVHALAEEPGLLSFKMLNAIREYWEVKEDLEGTIQLILEAGSTGMGYREVANRRKAAAAGPIKRPRSTKEDIVFKGGKGELKSFEDGGRIELSLKGLTPDEATELTSKIRSLFPMD